jgi:hypothetical protein
MIEERLSEAYDPRPIVRSGFDEHMVVWAMVQDAWFGRDLENASANSAASVVAARAVDYLDVPLRRLLNAAIDAAQSIAIREAMSRLPEDAARFYTQGRRSERARDVAARDLREQRTAHYRKLGSSHPARLAKADVLNAFPDLTRGAYDKAMKRAGKPAPQKSPARRKSRPPE